MLRIVPLLLLLGFFAMPLAAAEKAALDKAAPEFSLPDASGKTHALADFKGKIVVLEWVNFGCPYVRKHYDSDNMQSLQQNATKNGVIWLSICSSAPGKQGYYEGKELLDQLADEKTKATAYLVDKEGTVGRMYEAKTTPHMYVIDKNGMLVYAGGIDDKPSASKDDIRGARNHVKSALDELMAGKTVSTKSSKPYGCSVKYK